MKTRTIWSQQAFSLLCLSLALCGALFFGIFQLGASVSEATAAQERPERCHTAAEMQESDAERIVPAAKPLLLRSVPLDAETQWQIYDLCAQDEDLFCAVMAIANQESRFDTDAVGDNGRSVGMMQINYGHHIERMESLSVTDLTNPVQCAAVGISYLQELAGQFDVGPDSQILYLAYNMGPTGARKAMARGQYSSGYTRSAACYYEAYRQEFIAGG